MILKYKNFKQMDANEMKNVVGGQASGGCKTTGCFKWDDTTMKMENGTCSAGTVTVNGTTLNTCDCSISGGSSCWA
jgi:bacteriocin-like protein